MHIPTDHLTTDRLTTDPPATERPADGHRPVLASAAGTSMRIVDVPAGGDLGHRGPGRWAELCPSPHWGYVLEGSVEVRFAFGERETARAGELYHWPALHTCWTDEGVRALEFGPVPGGSTLQQGVVASSVV